MNLLLLLVSLIILLFVTLTLCKGDLLAPLPLSIASFSLTTFIAFSFNGSNGLDISINTAIIIILSLLIYGVGYVFTSGILQKTYLNQFSLRRIKVRVPSNRINILVLLISLIALYNNLRSTMALALTVDSDTDMSTMLMNARNAEMFNNVHHAFLPTLMTFWLSAIGYLYIYLIVNEKIACPKKFKLSNHILELIIISVSIMGGILSTNRTFMIKIFAFVVVCFYYIKYIKRKKDSYSLKESFHMMKSMIIIMVLFFGVFQLLGMTTGKTFTAKTNEMIYGYSGAAIMAFDRAVETYQPDNRYWGEQSFYGLYGLLNVFGADIPNEILHLPFVTFRDGRATNIYTSLHSYLYDFGYGGLYLIQFLLGIISAIAYFLLKRLGIYPWYIFLYSLLIYGIAMQGVEDMTLRDFMSVTNVITFILFYVMSKLCYTKT